MTFYNIISAVLFVGAFREVLFALQSGDQPALWRAGVLALLVFNDAIYTSWYVETRQKKYLPILMFIDLVNFAVLTAALIFLRPGSDNILELDLNRLKDAWLTESRFWGLLALYWVLVEVWTLIAGVFHEKTYKKWLIPCSLAIIVLFAIEAALVRTLGSASSNGFSHFMSFVAFSYPVIYILVIRSLALSGLLDAPAAPPAPPPAPPPPPPPAQQAL